MIESLTTATLPGVCNATFRNYASRYAAIADNYRESVALQGVPFAQNGPAMQRCCGCAACPSEGAPMLSPELAAHIGRGLAVENDGKSFWVNWRSPACDACERGEAMETFIFSTRCPRSCFFCFNPNQSNQTEGDTVNDLVAELRERHAQGKRLDFVALSGGEPLLYKERTLEFLKTARSLFPGVHTRLYTSGFGLDAAYARELAEAGLDEVRFSIKTDDSADEQERTFERIGMAREVVPCVMVEMPVIPGELELMKELLVRLDALGVDGINLLELGFPFHNAEAFVERGLRLKPQLMRVLYNYWYSGGAPVDGSEEACLELLQFALDAGLRLGVHYCSLENKYTSQVFSHNVQAVGRFPLVEMSERDYFLKSAKVFGDDQMPVRAVLERESAQYKEYDDYNYLEFPLSAIPLLTRERPSVEVGISYAIAEERDGSVVLRELRVDKTTPAQWDPATDR